MLYITVESSRQDHRRQAEHLIDYLAAYRRDHPDEYKAYQGNHTLRFAYLCVILAVRHVLNVRAARLGVAGPPGAGKSTFIEALGCKLLEQQHKVAVVAIGWFLFP